MQLKRRIASQFSRAAKRYDCAAQVQIDIARDALRLFKQQAYGLKEGGSAEKSSKYILDIGCGTGRVTRQLAALNINSHQHIMAMDLAFGMLQYAQQTTTNKAAEQQAGKVQSIQWIQGDAEHIPIGDNTAGGVFSSMALQWCNNSALVCREINRVLAPNAQGVLAIMCTGSMHELDACWQHIDSERQINHFDSAENWFNAAKAAGLQVEMLQKNFITWHANVRELLGSMKQIGANVVTSNTRQKTIGRQTLQYLEQYYQREFGNTQGLPLTYSVCFLKLRKNAN
nr:methyltransferase domain-containing protein [Paraglaciecola sp. 20A4]